MINPLPQRKNERPTLATEGPQRQLDGQSPPALWGTLVAALSSLPGVQEGHSQTSPACSRAFFPTERRTIEAWNTTLTCPEYHPDGRLEPFHIHGVQDTSLHMCLPVDRAREVCEQGWGQPHAYADYETQVFVYGPLDEDEYQVVLGLAQESLEFARAHN